MDWYPWYFDIFSADTMHLNPYQDGCYRRLIDHYMRTRTPLIDNDAALARIVGDSEANWVAMASLLVRPFFKPKNGRLHLKRCDDILNNQDNKTRALSESGKNGAKKRWGKINSIDSHPIATPLATLKPHDSRGEERTVEEEKEPKGSKKKFAKQPAGVSDETWSDFLTHRSAKKAPVTETVLKNIQSEAVKLGWNMEQALAEMCARNWQGFKAEWVKNSKGNSNGTYQQKLTYTERLEAAGNLGVELALADWEARQGGDDIPNASDRLSNQAMLSSLQPIRQKP